QNLAWQDSSKRHGLFQSCTSFTGDDMPLHRGDCERLLKRWKVGSGEPSLYLVEPFRRFGCSIGLRQKCEATRIVRVFFEMGDGVGEFLLADERGSGSAVPGISDVAAAAGVGHLLKLLQRLGSQLLIATLSSTDHADAKYFGSFLFSFRRGEIAFVC